MSIHPSLRGVNSLVGQRSVYTRVERIQKLIADGTLEEDGSPHGLPKVRTQYKVKSAKKATDETAEGEAGADAEGEEQAEASE